MSARTREKVQAAAAQSGFAHVLNETGDRPATSLNATACR